MFSRNLLRKFVMTVSLFAALPAAAQIEVWDFDNGVKNKNTSLFDSLTISNGLNANRLTITGWSNTGDGSTIETGKLKYSNSYGLMLTNQKESANNSPDHSIDSYNTFFDMVLLTFDQAIDLTGFGLGWAREGNTGVADISIAAFTGIGNASIAGNTWSGIASSNSWSTIGRYSNVGAYQYQGVTTDVKSKYWLVGAYNPIFNNPNDSSWTTNNDGFKLASVQGETSRDSTVVSVPEPSSIAILGLGLLGFISVRKKRN